MQSAKRRVSLQDLGLEAGLVFSRYFLKTEHLHYGYWTDNLKLDIANLRRAQEDYCELIVSHIPKDVQSILDVGCGTGGLALGLKNLGYAVDCVSPSPFLTKEAAHRLKDGTRIFACRYEDLDTDRRYDLALFSESFQYIDLDRGLRKTANILTDHGYLMICDVFRKETQGDNRIGGGMRLSKFLEALANYPLSIIADIDITEQTAPTMDLANDVCVQVLRPIWQSVFCYLDSRCPALMRVIRWKFKKRMEKIERKYFEGERSAEHFCRFKTYRLMLIQNGVPSADIPVATRVSACSPDRPEHIPHDTAFPDVR